MQAKLNQEDKMTTQYLIIGGAPKSATTSLFRYLSDHPQICPAKRKETYFFAREFDVKQVCKFNETLEDFEKYFDHCSSQDKLRLEATPYTLYSKNAAERIAKILPNAAMLFVLRDPVERLFSDYRFQTQRDNPNVKNQTFEEYIDKRLNTKSSIPNTLELGCYMQFLSQFFDMFTRDRVIILFFEKFKANPLTEMQKLCIALNINKDFYTNYGFDTHNQTINVRYDWLNKVRMGLEPVVENLRERVIHHPKLHRTFENQIHAGKLALQVLNSSKKEVKEGIHPEIQGWLAEYYQSYNQKLFEEMRQPLPWKSFQEA